MKTPIFVRDLTVEEQERLKIGLRSKDRFELRRSQIVLASARKETARRIARTLGCDDQTVRNVIKQFNTTGLDVLKAGSHRPHKMSTTFTAEKVELLKDILHQSPRNFGKETSLWTLNLLAEVSFSEKIAERLVTGEAIRITLKRFDISWNRAKHWISSPDPAYLLKKNNEIV
jgi:transposase